MSENAREHLIFAFRRVLRPLVKILLRAGVRFDEFAEILKAVYIESAIQDEIVHIKPLTRARVALATGVTRSDVDRIVDDPSLLKTPRATNVPMLAAILNKWHSDSNYLGPYGMPLELAIDQPGAMSFRGLSESLDPTLDWLVLLEDLLGSGVVSKSGEHHVKVNSRTFVVPSPMSAKVLEYFGNTITNLAHTLEYNMDPANESKRLERSVFPDDGLPLELRDDYEKYVRDLVQELMNDIDNWVADSTKGRDFAQQPRLQTGLSIFSYVVDPVDERTLRELITPDSPLPATPKIPNKNNYL